MNPIKLCDKCGERFRGTVANEMSCARCEVLHCNIPDSADQDFLQLGTKLYGPTFATMIPLEDIMNHNIRLKKLEEDLEKSRKTTKEKNRIKREIHRIREEKKAMEELMESIKTKMMKVAFTQKFSKTKSIVPSTSHSPYSTPSGPTKSSPIKSTIEPKTPRSPVKIPQQSSPPQQLQILQQLQAPQQIQTPQQVQTPQQFLTPQQFQTPQQLQTPHQFQTAQQQLQTPQQPQSLPSCFSPVKSTAAKFEEAAKKVNTVVTFAKIPKKTEVNNNDTPVTASSSSEDDDEDSGKNQVFLTRSNSVRDRVKAFEEIQRRASTGSCDRKKPVALRGMTKNQKSLNVL